MQLAQGHVLLRLLAVRREQLAQEHDVRDVLGEALRHGRAQRRELAGHGRLHAEIAIHPLADKHRGAAQQVLLLL